MVIMVQLSGSSPSGSCRASHRPAKTKGSPELGDTIGLLWALAPSLPFIEAIRRNEAAEALEGTAEARRLGCGAAATVSGGLPDRGANSRLLQHIWMELDEPPNVTRLHATVRGFERRRGPYGLALFQCALRLGRKR